MTPEELPVRLRGISLDVKARAAVAAADAMAQTYQSEVVRSMGGAAPSPPGTPPARRTGTLARSVRAKPATGGGGRATSSVSPHTVYARIQQLGGDIYPVRAKNLRWKSSVFGPLNKGQSRTGYVYAKHVHLPARPYMVMNSGRRQRVHDAAVRAVRGLMP